MSGYPVVGVVRLGFFHLLSTLVLKVPALGVLQLTRESLHFILVLVYLLHIANGGARDSRRSPIASHLFKSAVCFGI